MNSHVVKFPSSVVEPTRKITGQERTVRLRRLAQDVYNNHRGANRAHAKWLDRVHEAGKALLEAKRLLGGRGKWGRWMRQRCADATKDGYNFSPRTARAYMQVAKKWDDPLVTEEREKGSITSINALLRVVKKPWTAESVQKSKQQEDLKKRTQADILRFELRKMFNQDLKGNYALDELDVFYSEFYEIADIYRQEVRSRVLDRENPELEAPEPEMTREEEEEYERKHEKQRRRMVNKLRQANPDLRPSRKPKRKAS